jgi:hypothetical protein
VTGVVPDAQGKFSIPESAVFPGATNFLRIRGEGPAPSRYSAAATVAIDPAVDSSSPNQVKYVSVSRSGTQVTVRWQLQQANGKKFKVYFTRVDTGQAVLLTQCRAMARTRHRRIHAHFGVDWSLVWRAATEDVPRLVGRQRSRSPQSPPAGKPSPLRLR